MMFQEIVTVSDQNNLIIYIIIGVMCLLFATWIIITIIRLIIHKSNRIHFLVSQGVSIPPGHLSIGARSHSTLSEQDIELYMPRNTYKRASTELKKNGIHSVQICCVCLADFVEEDIIRTTFCYHIFHFECLD